MVIDSSIFIEYLRATNITNTTLQKLPDQSTLYVSSVTLYGLYMHAAKMGGLLRILLHRHWAE